MMGESDFVPVPKQHLKDPDYLKQFQTLCKVWRYPCFVTKVTDGTVVPHHVTGRKNGDKWNLVAVCFRVHRDIHDHGYNFVQAKYGVSKDDFVREANRLYESYVRIYRDDGE